MIQIRMTEHYSFYIGLPLPLPMPPIGIPPPGIPWSPCPDLGFLTVSSTDRIKQAASLAAVIALIFTTAGSQTHFYKTRYTKLNFTMLSNHT